MDPRPHFREGMLFAGDGGQEGGRHAKAGIQERILPVIADLDVALLPVGGKLARAGNT